MSSEHPDLSKISNVSNKVPLAEKAVESDVDPDPSLALVPPLVVSFDEGEGAAEEKDFGIKTLEQIQMEKIHKESDSYYGAGNNFVQEQAAVSMLKRLILKRAPIHGCLAQWLEMNASTFEGRFSEFYMRRTIYYSKGVKKPEDIIIN